MTYKEKVQNCLQAKIDQFRKWAEEERNDANRAFALNPLGSDDEWHHRDQADKNDAAADVLQMALNEIIEL